MNYAACGCYAAANVVWKRKYSLVVSTTILKKTYYQRNSQTTSDVSHTMHNDGLTSLTSMLA